MKTILLNFKKLGNHWYLNIPHDNPSDLCLDELTERYFNLKDKYNYEEINNICIIEESDVIINEGLIQFREEDLLRYYTTDDKFTMTLYIDQHKFKISSNLYSLIDQYYNLNLHSSIYRIKNFK